MPAMSTSLLSASRAGDVERAQALIKSGADLEERDSSGRTALMLAVGSGHLEIVRCLLRTGASTESRQCQQKTALHIAAECSSGDECVRALVEAGAKVDVTDVNKNTPLLLVMKRENKYTNNAVFVIMKHLIEARCDLDRRDTEQRTALHYASYRAVGTELLLSAGASPNPQDEDGNTPLHLASIEGFDTVVRCLTTFNCNPNLVNHCGKMPVHYLAMKGHWEGIEDIIRCGGYLDHADNDQSTPLWYAVNHNRVQAVRSLLRGNCCPDLAREAPDDLSQQLSPLALALQCRYHVIARQLVIAGCCLRPLRAVLLVREARHLEREALMRQSVMLRDLLSSNPSEKESVEEAETMEWLSHWISGPPALKQLCRVRIRACVRPRVMSKVMVELATRLPQALQDFIELKELQELTS